MVKAVLAFIPKQLDIRKTGYFKGFSQQFPDCEAIYITSYKIFNSYSSDCVGFIGRKKHSENLNFLLQLSNGSNIFVDKLFNSEPVTIIIYNYDDFKQSHMLDFEVNYGRHLQVLSNKLQIDNIHIENESKGFWKLIIYGIIYFMNTILLLYSKSKYICMHSATLQHMMEMVISTKMLFQELYDNKKNPILYNHLSAKLIDIILGMVALNCILTYEGQIVELIQVLINEIIYNLKDLLLYLMGSPIGLKLNHAFNMSLGQFYFYHISLWKIFLLGIEPIFSSYLRYFVLSGIFGISVQFAMISDLISILTFHIYCIYVYAARLFNLQLKCLISLWRLFIGKKYNPLRERVDSCQYSPNQLFIGTLIFTVLLFLLPTTIMYYAVFCMFRLVIIAIDTVLLNSIQVLKSIPMYIVVLWLKGSSSLAGSICMIWKNYHKGNCASVEVQLKILPFMQCIKLCMPTKNEYSTSIQHKCQCIITGTLF